jgi:non-specific serine/threonine protein kinase
MPVSTSMRRPRNLPADLTSFVGRERELPAVKRLLADFRMVTLTGPGGVGKTRLALRAAAEVQWAFPDGAWFVELAGLQDPSLVPQTVADTLGIQATSESGPLESLVDFLRLRELLLVLDNCEHLIDACTVLAESLLRSCPELRILATSRHLLYVEGEHVLQVPPLPVPAPGDPGEPERIRQYAAVRLFSDRAEAVHPDFVVDLTNQLAVSEICRRLDGIPLALELAASRLRSLSVQQLHERLDDRYAVLTGGSAAALPRQQTLRALIEWSFDLCSLGEQQLWARLSVFGDGFDLHAAEYVCADEGAPAGEVFDLLASLVDKSIVATERLSDRVRYHLPETLREFGHGRLSEADEATFSRRLRDWCRTLVSRASDAWFTPGQVEAFTTLRREHSNLRRALGFCLTHHGEGAVGLEMASALRFYWLIDGSLSEGRHWLDRLLAIHESPDLTRVEALQVNGHLATLLNDHEAAAVLLEEARGLAANLGDPLRTAYVTQTRGLAALFRGDAKQALPLLHEAQQQHTRLGDVGAAAYDGIQLALATVLLGDQRRALELIEDSLTLCESSGENWTTALALFALCVEACRNGKLPRSLEAGRKSIELRLPLEDRRSIGLNFEALAWTAAASGDAVRAARLFGAAQAVQLSIGTSLRALGHLAELHDLYEPVARASLGDDVFGRELAAGMRLEFDDAVAYALDQHPEHPADPGSEQPDAERDAVLTRREREVAELVAQGRSNKEIATRLVISLRTAEAHVQHILAKLGFTSRAQIAVWVVQHRSGQA